MEARCDANTDSAFFNTKLSIEGDFNQIMTFTWHIRMAIHRIDDGNIL